MKKYFGQFVVLMMCFVLVTSILSGCTIHSTKERNNYDVTLTPTYAKPEFNDLNAKEITKAMSPGWNLGNQLEAVDEAGVPKETNWNNPVITENLIKTVKTAGFKSIRIPISYFNMIGNAPNYKIKDEWLDRIQEVVNYVVDNDLYAVIDIHGDGYQSMKGGWLYIDSPDQASVKVKFRSVWKQISKRFRDYDEHLIFETMNEISDMSYGVPKPDLYKNINAYNQIALDTIRKTGGYNEMRWVLMPGWNADIEDTASPGSEFKIPKDTYLSNKITTSSRIMISVHYYSPWDFCGGESGEITQWGKKAKDIDKTSKYSDESYMEKEFKLLYDSFTSKNIPVVIGEYGAVDKSMDDPDNPYYREYFNRKVNENSLKYGCIPLYWDNGYNAKYGFALFDRGKATITQPGIIKAIMSVYQ